MKRILVTLVCLLIPFIMLASDFTIHMEVEDHDAKNGVNDGNGGAFFANDGSWLLFEDVDFGSGVDEIEVYLSISGSNTNCGNLNVYKDSISSDNLVCTLTVEGTSGLMDIQSADISMQLLSGNCDMYIEFDSNVTDLLKVDWVEFENTSSGIKPEIPIIHCNAESYSAGDSSDIFYYQSFSFIQFNDGDFACFKNVELDSDCNLFKGYISVPGVGEPRGTLEVYIDSINTSNLICELPINGTASILWAFEIMPENIDTSLTDSTHDIYIKYAAPDSTEYSLSLDWFKFE